MLGLIGLMALADVFTGILGLRKRTPQQALRAAPASAFNLATAGALAVTIGLGPRGWFIFAGLAAMTLYEHLAYRHTRHRPGPARAMTARLFR